MLAFVTGEKLPAAETADREEAWVDEIRKNVINSRALSSCFIYLTGKMLKHKGIYVTLTFLTSLSDKLN